MLPNLLKVAVKTLVPVVIFSFIVSAFAMLLEWFPDP